MGGEKGTYGATSDDGGENLENECVAESCDGSGVENESEANDGSRRGSDTNERTNDRNENEGGGANDRSENGNVEVNCVGHYANGCVLWLWQYEPSCRCPPSEDWW